MTKKSSSEASSNNLQELLDAVFTVCLMDKSLSRQALDRSIDLSRKRARRVVATLRPDRKARFDNDLLGFVIYRWQRLPKYLDEHGKPLALPARGRGKSIEGIFKEVKRPSYYENGLTHLLRTRRVLKAGRNRYLPNGETTLIHTLTPELVEHLTQTVNRLVATVLHNTSAQGPRASRLIERAAGVTDLPKKQVPAFKKFALEQGAVLINTLNDWLESRRDGSNARVSNSKDHLIAGIHVFGFLEKHGN